MIMGPDSRLLIVHPTGASHLSWSLPKGLREETETPEEAAAREVREETGLLIDSSKLIDLGRSAYTPQKDYHLFLYRSPVEIIVRSLLCESTFTNRLGELIAEVDRYQLVTLDEAIGLLNKKQSEIVQSVSRSDLSRA